MLVQKEQIEIKKESWFGRWFNSAYYHKLYAHRNEDEAQNFINELLAQLQPPPNARMIDVGCGTGRHCKWLASKGFDVTGVDFAFDSIKAAKKHETQFLRFFQHDMRIPFGKNYYDYCYSFFTSFGYFETMQENEAVIQNMSNALKPGATLVFDYLNVQYSEDHLVSKETKEIDGINYSITRWHDDKKFYKKVVIDDAFMPKAFENVEQVRKFTLGDFAHLFKKYNLQIEDVYGDYKLAPYDKKRSPRLVMIAKKIY